MILDFQKPESSFVVAKSRGSIICK
uniref:Uncharacterized protein n=1 Tax=Arundo donax TaxID=35708 RepID=A0A0A9BRE2_ARUDO